MSQCTCKCNTSQEAPQVEVPAQQAAQEDVPAHPQHRRRIPSVVCALSGQTKEDVIRLIEKADKDEAVRLHKLANEPQKVKLTYEEGEPVFKSFGMPILKRDEVVKMPPVDLGDDDDINPQDREEANDGSFAFMLRKLAGVEQGSMEDFKTTKCVKEKVVATLGQKYYGRVRFEWSNDPDSYLEEFLLINDAKTKISATPLVEIFHAVSKITSEEEAMSTACQVVINKVAALFE